MTDENVKNILQIFNIFKNSGIFLTFSTNVEIFDYSGSFGKAFAKVQSKKKTTEFQTTFGCRNTGKPEIPGKSKGQKFLANAKP